MEKSEAAMFSWLFPGLSRLVHHSLLYFHRSLLMRETGDVGSSMLSHHGQKQNDIRAVGWIMTEIMEPGNSYLNPNSLVLKNPRKWGGEILEFHKKTDAGSIPDLLSVSLHFIFWWITVWPQEACVFSICSQCKSSCSIGPNGKQISPRRVVSVSAWWAIEGKIKILQGEKYFSG